MTIKKEIYLSYAFKDSYIKKAEKGKRKGLFWGEERLKTLKLHVVFKGQGIEPIPGV